MTIPRNLNLLIDDDLSTLFQELARLEFQLPVTSEDELKKLIHFGREFLPESAFVISAGMTPIGETLMAQIRGGQADRFLNHILPIIYFLNTFRDDTEFTGKIKANLANQSQFNDTFFELQCLNHFHRNGCSFQYEPKVYDGIKERNPDFRLTKGDIELFCECKQIRVGQDKAELKFDEQHAYVESKFLKTVQTQLFNAKLRLEVNFKIVPSSADLDELARQVNRLSSDAHGIRELPLQQLGNSIEYLVIPQNESSPFPMRTLRTISMRVRIGEFFSIGNPLNSPGGEISFVSTDLAWRQAKTLGRNITGAKNQLPNNKPSIIILNRAKLKIADQVIKRRIGHKQYANIFAIIVNPFDDFWSAYRTGYREFLFEIFEGFQPENFFKSN